MTVVGCGVYEYMFCNEIRVYRTSDLQAVLSLSSFPRPASPGAGTLSIIATGVDWAEEKRAWARKVRSATVLL